MLVEAVGFLVGLGLLLVGADRTVDAAADLARYYGVPPFVIGVTIISIGTSIPETVTSVYGAVYGAGDLLVGNIVGSETAQITLAIGVVAGLAARRGAAGISVGALLGSDITDPVFSLGVGALFADVVVTDLRTAFVSTGYMLAVSLVVLGLMYWRRGIDRRAAIVCLGCYTEPRRIPAPLGAG